MRALFVSVLLTLLADASAARADCASGGVWAWPAPGAALDPSGRIVLDAHHADQAWVLEIARLAPRLVGGGHTVPLRVVESHRGSFDVSQVVLAAEQPLRVGGRYHLVLDGRPTPTVWTGNAHAPLRWTVAASGQRPPRFRSAPQLERTSFTPFGCGPAVYAHVLVDVSPRTGVIFRVRVEEVSGGGATEYLVPARDGRLDVGHGMCSGPFRLRTGIDYRIRIDAVDLAGREASASREAIVVTGPGFRP